MSSHTEEAIPETVIVWSDLEFTLLWGGVRGAVASSSTWMNWALVLHMGEEVGTGKVVYRAKDGRDVEHPCAAEPELSGFIKWDGCMQTDAASLHWDDRAQIRHLAEALERIRDQMRVLRASFGDDQIEGR